MDNYVGKMLDNRYEILEVIGVGGMAVVYKSRCHRLNRLVAVKILKDEFAQNDDFRKRFHAESQAVAMLSHPNIVAVYDVSRTGDTEYIVMELIDGITLKQYMQKKGQLNWREALHFATQITKALGHAHGRGIIHRDIKPHNIMILRDGSVKVADFGIARLASTQNTLTQEALGSVHYISPEQARGSHIDARSDIYSVGVVLYEMLTDRLPYEGESPVSVAIQHINSIPLTPREIDPNIPSALESITMKSMSPSLSKRYSSAEMLLNDLEEFRKNPSISFDYNIEDLTTREESDEPTKNLATSGGVAAISVKGQRPRSGAQDTARNKRQNNKSITMLTGVLSILVFVGAMVYLFFSMLSGWGDTDRTDNNASVQVPKLVGLVFTDVMNDATNEAYKDIIINPKSESEFHDAYEIGVIIKQDPEQNAYIKKGGTVTVTLSKGKQSMPLPDVGNWEYREAQRWLTDNGFKCATEPIYEYHDDVVKDYVIRTSPDMGVSVDSGTLVTLHVSRGPEVANATMPNLMDRTLSEAERLLEQFDLILGTVDPVDSALPKDTVVYQSVTAGTAVPVRTEVNLQISLGDPEESPSPDPDVSANPGESQTPSPTPTTDPTVPTTPPDPAASADPVSPSSVPTTITVPVVVEVPSENATVKVEIRLNNITQVTKEINTSSQYFSHSLTGDPEAQVEIYFDGMLYYTRQLKSFAT